MRLYEPIAGIEGVASGASATVKIPANRRLHLFKLVASAMNVVPAAVYGTDVIDEVLVYVGGKLQRNITSAELVAIANLNGRVTNGAAAGDAVSMFMSEPWRASVMDEQVTAFDLWGVGDVTLKVKIKAGLTVPTLKVVMAHDDGFTTNGKGERLLNIIRHTPFFFNAGTQYDITALDLDKPIQRIYLFPASGTTINSVKATVNDSVVVHELTQQENQEFLADYKLVSELGNGKMYPLCFDLEQQVFNMLAAPRSLRISINQTAAGQVKALLENRAGAYV